MSVIKYKRTKFIDYKDKVGKVISLNRKQIKQTQHELAKKVGCDQSIISRIESGSKVVDKSMYDLALASFSFDYIESDEINAVLLGCFEEAALAFIEVDLDKLDAVLFKLHNYKKTNVYVNYHLKIIEYVYDYLSREHEDLTNMLDMYDEIIDLLLPEYRLLLLIVKLNLALYDSDFDMCQSLMTEINEKFEVENEQYRQFFGYYVGWYYFKRNNRSMALKHLLYANEYFIQTDNQIRQIRVELIIANLLLRERNYPLVLRKYTSILSKFKSVLRDEDRFRIYLAIGYTYFSLKKYDDAIIYLNRALAFSSNGDVNHVYYYLLKIYKLKDDVSKYKEVLSNINYRDQQSFGTVLITIFLQSQIGKTEKYYQYIDNSVSPFVKKHYQHLEIYQYFIELLDYCYKKGLYYKYYQLTKQLYLFFN